MDTNLLWPIWLSVWELFITGKWWMNKWRNRLRNRRLFSQNQFSIRVSKAWGEQALQREKKETFFNFSVFPQSHSLFSASLQTFCLTVWETTWIRKNTNCFAVKWGNIWYSMQQWTVLMLVLACHLSPHGGFSLGGYSNKNNTTRFLFSLSQASI